jgi:hypothetical protein
MTIRSKSRLGRAAVAAAAVGSLIAFGSSLARAQTMLSASQVEDIIERSGYEVLGPAVRHGSTYVADVVGEGDISEQFVIDAHDGRLLHRYRTNSAIRRHAASPPPSSGLTGFFDTLFGGADVTPLPPPPADEFSDKPLKPKPHTRRPATASLPAAHEIKTPSAATATPVPAATAPNPEPHQPETVSAPAAPTPIPSAPAKTASPKPNDVQVAPLE